MIYIQSDNQRSLPHHFDAACALYGAIEHASNYRLTTYDEVSSGKFDSLIRENLFVGSTEFMQCVFGRIGLSDVRLPLNSNREFKLITFGEAKNIVSTGKKIFIKPVEIKLFTGLVLDGMEYTALSKIPDSTLVMAYEPFEDRIRSEWRLYVHNHKIIDSRNYSGDFMIQPDYLYAFNEVMDNKPSFPCAYTIDIGILNNGKNVVIEYNDMWAIGNYGIDNYTYVRLLRDRYFEIVRY